MAALPPEQLREIDQDIAALAEQTSRPIVCPLLDQSAGACRAYTRDSISEIARSADINDQKRLGEITDQTFYHLPHLPCGNPVALYEIADHVMTDVVQMLR